MSQPALSSEEKEARSRAASRARGRPKVRPYGWEPFGNAPETVQRRFKGKLGRAHARPMDAIYLFCVECHGYSLDGAKACACLTCPLYALNRRLFA